MRQTVQSMLDNLDSITLKGGDEVCPAGLAKHAQQTRQSMPSRQDKACPSKRAPQDRQSMLSRAGKACPSVMPSGTDKACSAEQAKHGQQEAHLEPGSDVKVLLHVRAQHLVDNHRPEESRVL